MKENIYVGNDYTQEYHHKEQSAVIKLLIEKQGFVKGAFYRDDIGDIDLLWGNESYGLCHILKRRTEQIGEEKALKFISHLAENIKNGVMIEAKYNRIGIITNKTTIILEQTEDNQFILTAYIDKKNTLKLENLQSVHDVNFIDESISTLNKGFDVLSPNQSQEPIIPQNPKPLHSSQFKVQKINKVNKSKDKAIIPTRQRKR